MKRLIATIIPVFLITFLIIYSSCNEAPVEGTSSNSSENLKSDNNSSSINDNESQSGVLSTDGKNFQTGSESEPNLTDAAQPCGFGMGPGGTVYVTAGSNYTFNYSAWAAIPYSPTFTSRSLNILRNGAFVTLINNWTQGTCGNPLINSWNNSGSGTISLGAGTHTISARLIYSCVIGGQSINIDTTINRQVIVITLTIPSVPNTSFSTSGFPPSRRPLITWTASSPNVTSYVIQRRYYPSGSFQDYATVSGSTLSFIDNNITVITHRYDHEYYKVEYRVRAVNQIGASGYQAPSYSWYSHGCYSYTLGHICAEE